MPWCYSRGLLLFPPQDLNNLQPVGCCFSLPYWLIGVNACGENVELRCCSNADDNEPKLANALNVKITFNVYNRQTMCWSFCSFSGIRVQVLCCVHACVWVVVSLAIWCCVTCCCWSSTKYHASGIGWRRRCRGGEGCSPLYPTSGHHFDQASMRPAAVCFQLRGGTTSVTDGCLKGDISPLHSTEAGFLIVLLSSLIWNGCGRWAHISVLLSLMEGEGHVNEDIGAVVTDGCQKRVPKSHT